MYSCLPLFLLYWHVVYTQLLRRKAKLILRARLILLLCLGVPLVSLSLSVTFSSPVYTIFVGNFSFSVGVVVVFACVVAVSVNNLVFSVGYTSFPSVSVSAWPSVFPFVRPLKAETGPAFSASST